MTKATPPDSGEEMETVTSADAPESTLGAIDTLELYSGALIAGVYFSRGYSVSSNYFTTVPSGIDPFVDVRVITPEGERILYCDPEEAIESVTWYHDFDKTVGGDITRDVTAADRAHVSLDADDGTKLELDISFGQTVGTRILNVMSALTPKSISRTRLGAKIGTTALNTLLDADGMKVAGRTETGVRYRSEAKRIYRITDASATLNGTGLGQFVRPPHPIKFGDIRSIPLYIHGDVFLPVPEREPVLTAEN
jgi:hypothetical protein